MDDHVRRIGYLQNCSKGNESVAFQMLHLVIGVFGGMPSYLVSLRVTLAFYLSCVLEVPSGVVADVLGHARALAYSCICQSVVCLLVLMAVLVGSESVSVALVVVSCVFSALGGALSSGSFQALIQDLIDKEASHLEDGIRADFRLKALSLSETHGAWFPAFFPVLILGSFFWIERISPHAAYLLLMPALTYLGLGVYFSRLVPSNAGHPQGSGIKWAWSDYRRSLRGVRHQLRANISNARYEVLLLSVLLLGGTLLMIHVHTYLMVAQLREIAGPEISAGDTLEMFLILVSFDLAHLFKGWFVPKLTLRYPPCLLVCLSYAALVIVALSAYMALNRGFDTVALVVFVLLFRSSLLLGQNLVQSALLSRFAERTRATVLSVINGAVILLYGTYSLYLTFVGIGSSGHILLEVVVVAFFGLLGAILLASFGCDLTADTFFSPED